MGQTSVALAVLLLASAMNAGFALPMSRMPRWSWQSKWLLWSLFALLILPNSFALLAAAHPYGLFAQTPPAVLFRILLSGVGWGIAQVLFGLAIRSAGVSLAFALVLGTSACAGGLLPLIAPGHSRSIPLLLMAGLAVMLAGLTMCAYAGATRGSAPAITRRPVNTVQDPDVTAEALLAPHDEPQATAGAWLGVLLAISAGLCASCMNFGLLAAKPLLQLAREANVPTFVAENLLWVPLLAGGAVPNVAYCLFLAHRQKSLSELRAPGTSVYVSLAFVMAVLWFGSNLAYSAAVQMLGELGPLWGWPAFMSLIVVLAGIFGFLQGEWKHADRRLIMWQGAGMTLLVFGVFLLSRNHG